MDPQPEAPSDNHLLLPRLRRAAEALTGAGGHVIRELLDDLHRRTVLLDRVCDAVPGWLVVIDAEGRFRAMSARYARAHGVTREDAVGAHCTAVAPERAAAYLEALAGFSRGGPASLAVIEQHGGVTWSADYLPLRGEQGEVLGLVLMARPSVLDHVTFSGSLEDRSRYFAELRRRLHERGYQGSTILGSEALLLYLLPLFASGLTWRGQVKTLVELCGRSGTAVRRSIHVLANAGVVGVRRRGPAGIELTLRVVPGATT